ncbi:hypothetical protein IM792_13590 [Mucilaginibacter sp. JRF]|uniref:DUF7687 domain-containing protein n=1 Tax=Mucilaginibacter sp. JRF TaxID=2780088 RepID=UPI0018809478|nr:hypothetical protein [Mucilaginibacter sp. JRF]MBE9585484.1 hypothetical protein [Mucilaginibacter sp. JRF]
MKPNPKYINNTTPEFWANVKVISQKLGYTDRKTGSIKVHSISNILDLYNKLGFKTNKLVFNDEETEFGQLLVDYFQYRSDAIGNHVQHYLMDLNEAKGLFEQMCDIYNPKCEIPINKQGEGKNTPNYFTGIINILLEANIGDYQLKYSASELTAFTLNRIPFRSLSRRVDGSFPSVINPIALWEIKEYYYTKSFGSRVADAVYETQLDGIELNEVRKTLDRNIRHYLMIDSKFTWWVKGRSYLCRIFDMMHMGLLTEAIFGKEVIDRIPVITQEWISDYERLKDFLDA